VSKLFEKLTAAGLKVWWDKQCLKGAQKWEDGFVDGMLNSAIIVPVLSRKMLVGFEALKPDSSCDNVLLEHIMMLELVARGESKGIFPVLVGERMDDGRWASFFEGKASVKLPKVRVAAVSTKLSSHLQRAKKGIPRTDAALSMNVPQVLFELLAYQGVVMEGNNDEAVEMAAQKVTHVITDLRAGGQLKRRGKRAASLKARLRALSASSSGSPIRLSQTSRTRLPGAAPSTASNSTQSTAFPSPGHEGPPLPTKSDSSSGGCSVAPRRFDRGSSSRGSSVFLSKLYSNRQSSGTPKETLKRGGVVATQI